LAYDHKVGEMAVYAYFNLKFLLRGDIQRLNNLAEPSFRNRLSVGMDS